MRLAYALSVALWSGAMTSGAGMVTAQGYPNKPIRIVATEAGGSGDFVLRLLAPTLSSALGQPVIVDNRPGATVAGEIVAKAAPDGYTLLAIGASFWIAPFLQKMPYDPVKDFSAIVLVTTAPVVLGVHPTVPVKSVEELVALAKAKSGELNYASTQTGGPIHLAAELLKSMTGVNIVRVPYKGTAQGLNALIGGEVQLMFLPPASIMPQAKAGKLKALAVSSAQPSLLAPGIPTMAATGLPGYEIGNSNGLFAPAKTPAPIIGRLNQEMANDLTRTNVREKLLNAGFEAVGGPPDVFAAKIKSDMGRLGKVIKDAGIRVE